MTNQITLVDVWRLTCSVQNSTTLLSLTGMQYGFFKKTMKNQNVQFFIRLHRQLSISDFKINFLLQQNTLKEPKPHDTSFSKTILVNCTLPIMKATFSCILTYN